jgi:O-antigen/teichoic acid export membrane protein
LSRFSKYFAADPKRSLLEKKKELSLLIRAEMIVATFIPLVLNIIWSPAIDALTGNKYGEVNKWTFFILSLCIPFQYISNLIWSTRFAQHRLKLILKITAISFLIVLVGDSVFIPMYGAPGAAIVYLIAMIMEYINFMRNSEISRIKESWQSLLACMIAAAGSGFVAVYFFENTGWQLGSAIILYSLLLLATRQLRTNDLQFVFRSARHKNKESLLPK